MNNKMMKPPGAPAMPAAAKAPDMQNFVPRGLMGGASKPAGVPGAAAMAPPDNARARAQRMIAEGKARRDSHRQDITARHAAMPKGLMR